MKERKVIMGTAKLTCLRKGGLFAGDRGKVHEQMIEKLGLKPITWGHIHAMIVFPKYVKELMTTIKI